MRTRLAGPAFFLLISLCDYTSAQNGLVRATPAQPAASAGGVQLQSAPTQPAQMPAAPTAPAAPRQPLPAGYATGAPMPMPLPSPPADLKAEAIDRIAPLTPKEILELRKELGARGAAMTQPLEPTAKPVRRVVRLDLSPGVAPEVIRTAISQGSVITFLDAAGRPWPVLAADNFNPSGFDIATFSNNGVSIGVKSAAARAGNLAVLLEGLQIPVTLSVQTGQREVDYSVNSMCPSCCLGRLRRSAPSSRSSRSARPIS